MRLFTVHLRRHGLDPERDLVLVEEGFSWAAFVFSAVWALWHRLWAAAAGILALSATINWGARFAGLDSVSEAVLGIGLAAIIGFVANDLRRHKLAAMGFVETAVVAAENRETALGRYLDDNPELAQDLAGATTGAPSLPAAGALAASVGESP